MLFEKIFNQFLTIISIITAVGVFMHDGRVDKASVTALRTEQTPLYSSEAALSSRFRDFIATDAHTHPDHNAAKQALFSSFTYQSPSIPPRDGHQRRHLSIEAEFGGRHAFDNTNLPIVS